MVRSPGRSAERLGRDSIAALTRLGASTLLLAGSLWTIVSLRARWSRTAVQIHQLGFRSIPIVTVAAFFTGMVMALHVSTALSRFGASLELASIVSASILRELAPIFTALLVAGRAGSGIAAELGTMKATEQLRAMRALSLSIERELIAPRVAATLFSMICLTLLADAAGILGGYFVAVEHLDLPLATYHAKTASEFEWVDLGCGLFKSAFFGLIVATLACRAGLSLRGGAQEVGRATKAAVVSASLTIIVSDYFLTRLFQALFE